MKVKIALFEDEIVISVEIKGIPAISNINIKTRFETEEVFNEIINNKKPLLVISDVEITNLDKKLSDIISSNVFDSINKSLPVTGYNLTSREKEILALLIEGLTKRKIADHLSLSFHTIDSHLRNIYKKLKVKSKSQAVAKTLNEGIL